MRIFKKLYIQVLIAIFIAIIFGLMAPAQASQMKPLGVAFIALLKMMLGPIIFCTVVQGIGHMKDFRKLGRLGVKTLVYFEIVSTLAMIIGWTTVTLIQPGAGLHAHNIADSSDSLSKILQAGTTGDFSLVHFLLSIIPTTFFSAFTTGDILPILLISLLVGFALSAVSKPDDAVFRFLDTMQAIVFKILGYIMRLSPLGAFGAMAAAVGGYGTDTLLYLLRYILTYYAASLIFIFIVLGIVTAIARLSIFRILSLIKEEIILAMSTGASEVAFPRLVAKLPQAGCDEAAVGFILPAGWSFNIDGACIYMACGLGFISQATDTPLSLTQQISLLAVMFVTSKGGAGATGGALVKLTASLQSTKVLPIEGVGLLFGIDRVLGVATSTTNVIGNTVATLVVSRWEGMLDEKKFHSMLQTRIHARHSKNHSFPIKDNHGQKTQKSND